MKRKFNLFGFYILITMVGCCFVGPMRFWSSHQSVVKMPVRTGASQMTLSRCMDFIFEIKRKWSFICKFHSSAPNEMACMWKWTDPPALPNHHTASGHALTGVGRERKPRPNASSSFWGPHNLRWLHLKRPHRSLSYKAPSLCFHSETVQWPYAPCK